VKRLILATPQVAIVFIIIACLFLVESAAFAATPTTAEATSTTTTLLASLYAQLATVQAEIAVLEDASTTNCTPVTLTRSLSLSSTGSEVSALQAFLQSQGDYDYPSITGYFGPVTEKAVISFQRANGIDPIGAVGPLTRSKISALGEACKTSATATQSTSTPVAITSIGSPIAPATPPPTQLPAGANGGTGIPVAPEPVLTGISPGFGGGGPPPSPSCAISSSPSSVDINSSTSLSWTSTNASSASLSGVGAVAVNGSQNVSPVATTTYQLTVSNNFGSATCDTSVGVILSPYVGYVATRGYIAVGDSSDKSLMSRTFHYARTNITSLQLVLPNWWINGSASAEQLIGGPATTTASIEYPAGTFTQVTFGGSATGTIPAGGTLVSDPVSVSIPNGAEFWVRIFLENSHGIVTTGQGDPNFGDAMTASTSIVADQTMGGTVASTTGSSIYMPAAIIGTTTEPSVFIVGDSRTYGNDDQSDDASGDAGEEARAIGPNFAYVNAGASGLRTDYLIDFMEADAPSDANMYKLASYASDIVNETGIVDVILGSTTAQIEGNLQTLWNSFPPGIPVYQTTMPPWTTSTDGWTTLANQTPNSDDAARIATNDLIRTTPSHLAGYFEVANVVESSRDSGLWKVLGYTTDGVHETTAANVDIENSGVFSTSSITR
jgi:peptidoglycan hydrolase-like protein with peptidoglycan-binding domain